MRGVGHANVCALRNEGWVVPPLDGLQLTLRLEQGLGRHGPAEGVLHHHRVHLGVGEGEVSKQRPHDAALAPAHLERLGGPVGAH